MIITKRALPRRTVLRGIGATLALPLLDAMVPALSASTRTAAAPVRRLGFLYVPNGVAMTGTVNQWTPEGVGTGFTFSPILKPLESFPGTAGGGERSQPQGGRFERRRQWRPHPWLRHLVERGSPEAHRRRGCASGYHRRPDRRDRAGSRHATAIARARLGPQLHGWQLRGRVQLRLHEHARLAHPDPRHFPAEVNPRIVFERLFGEGGTPEQRLAQARKDGQPSGCRPRPDDTFASKRSDRRIATRPATISTLCEKSSVAFSIPSSRAARRCCRRWNAPSAYRIRTPLTAELMFELQRLAFQADITRVFTFMLGRETSPRHVPRNRRLRTASWLVAPRQQVGTAREVRPRQYLSGAAVLVVPGEAAHDARRRRHPAGQFAAAVPAAVSATGMSILISICRSCWPAVRRGGSRGVVTWSIRSIRRWPTSY